MARRVVRWFGSTSGGGGGGPVAIADVTGLSSALAGKQASDTDLTTIAGLDPANDTILQRKASAWAARTPAQVKTDLALVAGDVGLGNVTNTADSAKPVSTAQQTALDLKANLASPTFTGTPAAPTASAATSTTQLATTAFVTTADNLKANLASPTFTGTPAAPTASAATSTTQLATTAFVTTADNLKANLASPTFTGTVAGITATMVGLGNVTNTADSAKPVSTAQQTALDLKANLASPTFTGTPAAPTAAAATSTTQLATTAFVTTADALKLSTNRTLATDPGSTGMQRTRLDYAVSTSTSDIEQVSVGATVASWRNEVGFLRGTPHTGYKDDALVRGIPRSDLVAQNGGFIELENSARTQVLYKRSWRTGTLYRGDGTAAAIAMSDVLVLAAAASVPSGTPANTVIVRLAV